MEFIKNCLIPNYNNSFHPFLIRKKFLAFISVVLLGVNLFSSHFSTGVSASSISAANLIRITNQERKANGLNELRAEKRLSNAAYAKAQNIFEHQYWSHYGPNDESPWQFILNSDYDYLYAGENLAKGFTSAEAVHSAWMASKTHRANILNSKYEDIGISVLSGNLLGSDVVLVVQMFGALKRDANSQDTNTAAEIPSDTETTKEYGEIEILYPEDGSFINEDNLELEGTVSDRLTDLEIYDNEDYLGDAIAQDGIWSYRSDKNWIEGEHEVKVKAKHADTSSTISFEIDTSKPQIADFDLNFDQEGSVLNNLLLEVKFDENISTAGIWLGQEFVPLNNTENIYEAQISPLKASSADSVEIIATDAAGNSLKQDISSEIKDLVSDSDIKSAALVSQISDSVSSGFNLAVITIIIAVLLVDAYFLFKLKLFQTRGNTLLPMAMWILIAGVATMVGGRGVIL